MTVKLFYKGAILRDPNDIDVQTMSRTSSPSELLYGPLFFTIVMTYLGLYKFHTSEAAIVMAALGIGDGIAPIIGTLYGRHRFRTPFGSMKSLEGSITVFLGTILGCYLFLWKLNLPLLPLRYSLIYGAVAAVMEACSPGAFDNLTVAGGILFCHGKIEDGTLSFLTEPAP